MLTRLDIGAQRPLVVGVSGAQGSGKTTAAAGLLAALEARGLRAAGLSLDDLYLTGAQRRRLAADVHPLLATRGPPGTHDVARGLALVAAARAGEPLRLPRFDKSRDEPRPAAEQPRVDGRLDVLVLEGWCVGAEPQTAAELRAPVNALEREEDPDGVWRGWVNAQLETPYRQLFQQLDLLAFLAAPDIAVVETWRREQEAALEIAPGGRRMEADEIGRFVQHYARITSHMLAVTPARADLTLLLDANRRVTHASHADGVLAAAVRGRDAGVRG